MEFRLDAQKFCCSSSLMEVTPMPVQRENNFFNVVAGHDAVEASSNLKRSRSPRRFSFSCALPRIETRLFRIRIGDGRFHAGG